MRLLIVGEVYDEYFLTDGELDAKLGKFRTIFLEPVAFFEFTTKSTRGRGSPKLVTWYIEWKNAEKNESTFSNGKGIFQEGE